MNISGILILTAATLIFACPAANAREQASHLKELKAGGVSLVYDTTDFAAVKIEKVKKNPVHGEGIADGESPAHYCFHFKDKRPLPALKQGPRYFFPTYSFICAFPLQDASVKDFDTAYFPLIDAAGTLRKILRERPANLERWRMDSDIPDFPDVDAGHSFVSKFQYMNFHVGTGMLFLTQYENENEPNPVNNEELTLVFEGLTKDGRYYVSARFAITQPSLPRGIDFTDNIKRDMYGRYLKKEAQELDRLPDSSFHPSIPHLKALLSSITIAP